MSYEIGKMPKHKWCGGWHGCRCGCEVRVRIRDIKICFQDLKEQLETQNITIINNNSTK